MKQIRITSKGADTIDWRESVYPGYFVSNNGLVKNRNRFARRKASPFLKPKKDKDGYFRIWIGPNQSDTGKRKLVAIHRLVAMAFHGIPKTKLVVNHKNGIRNDNRAENLEWLTATQNEQHARKVLGKRLLGEKASRSKIKTKDVIKIMRLAKQGLKHEFIGYVVGLTQTQVSRIVRGVNWGHLWKDKQLRLRVKDRAFWNWIDSKFFKES